MVRSFCHAATMLFLLGVLACSSTEREILGVWEGEIIGGTSAQQQVDYIRLEIEPEGIIRKQTFYEGGKPGNPARYEYEWVNYKTMHVSPIFDPTFYFWTPTIKGDTLRIETDSNFSYELKRVES